MATSSWREARVVATADLTRDIRALDIAPVAGAATPAAPGAHIKISLVIDGRPDTRSYSVTANLPGGGYRIAVKRLEASRGGSAYMATLLPGARLTISDPDNHFALAFGAPEYLLIAGGIGITPIFAHALALHRAGSRFRMLYAARSESDLAFRAELQGPLGERLETIASGAGARIDFADAFARLAPEGEAYVCGPIGMLEAAKHAWAAAGRPMSRLRFETFGASGAWPTAAFVARIPQQNREIQVPANRSLLEALEDAGVDVMSDCRKGECGLCALNIIAIDGIVDHRDVFFSAEEKASNHKLCACVSRIYGASVTLATADI